MGLQADPGSTVAVSKRQIRITRSAVALTLLFVLALAIRLWGIGWSLPDRRHPLATYHPDELINLSAAEAADIPHGKFDIGFYNYGAFYFYLVSLAHTVARGYGAIPTPAAIPPDSPPAMQMQAEMPERRAEFLVGRVVTALLGALTVLAVYGAGATLYHRRTGLGAAFLYAIAPLPVVHAHFLTVDVPATLFAALALWYAGRLIASQQPLKDGIVAGVFCGLAAATKYNAVLVTAAPLLALAFPNRKWTPTRLLTPPAFALLGATVFTFLIACPGPWLNWNVFWNGTYHGSGVRYELFEHSRAGHGPAFNNTGLGWWYHLVISLRFGLGLPFLIAALVGIVNAARRKRPEDLILLLFFGLYYGLTGLSAVRFARYMIPIVPVLCLWTADLFAGMIPADRNGKFRGAVGAVVALATAVYTVSLVAQMAREDPRDTAANYLEQHAPQGASVAFATIPWFYSPPLSPYFGAIIPSVRASAAANTTRFALKIPANEWDVAVLQPPPDYVVVSNLETMHTVDRLKLPVPVSFMRAIPSAYRKTVFGPATPQLALAGDGGLIPEDLLYIMPTVTVYGK